WDVRLECWKLLSNLKTTVEGLVSTNNPNVWSRYGGLQRLHKDMNNILSHGLKHEQVYHKQKDYWRFVWSLRFICPHLALHVDQFSQLEPVQSPGESYKAERWLLHSLQVHSVSSQLRPLLTHEANTRKFYNDEAFVLSEPHVSAMFQCLEAVEQNNPRLLALLNTVKAASPSSVLRVDRSRMFGVEFLSCVSRLSTSGSCGAPWVCTSAAGERSLPTAPTVPGISLTQPEAGDFDDGPEYLAIGNLGQHRLRRDSSSSTLNSAPSEDLGGNASGRASTTTLQPQRRNSFSEGQGGPGRSHARGHIRSLSDTGVTQKQRHGKNLKHSTITDGMFRKPSEGQSLISYLAEQDFGSCADLEKENAHFSISESLIAAIELMKCNMRRHVEDAEEEGDSDSEIQQLKQKIRLRRQQIRHSKLQPSTPSIQGMSSQDSFHLSGSGSAEEVEQCELKGINGENWRENSACYVFVFFHSSPSYLHSNSAESVAMGLLRQFEGMQLPAASELEWLVPEHDAPQKLLPIPDSLPISPDDGEHADIYKLRIRVRGNLEWAPPRPQIIFNIHPAPKRKVVVAKQNYRCAGCGIRIDPDYIKRLRYCEYLGRFFCQCCHENAQAVVPGRILRKWDFSKYYVSNFARDLLSKIAGDPLFNPNDINNGLYKKVKSLEAVRVLRVQLFHMKNLFKTCRLANELLDLFDSVPCYLTEDLHLFSLNDLTAVRNGDLVPKLRELLRLGAAHVAGCMLCQAKGFVCEFCGNDRDIVFPFELNKCQRCEECKACYHKGCYKDGKECPRCQRLSERRERMARKNMEEQEDRDENGE
uniref:RUN domain-containing protein n=1 Tax=Denticeps clupeoides TaxID=299321 RepID=A0AAY4DU05_9TELE